MNFDGIVKRTDLRLRTKYIYLKTKIYKLKDQTCIIFCENFDEDFTVLIKEFDNNIKPAAFPISLSTEKPIEYEYEILPIKDHEISHNFEGFFLRLIDLENLLLGKFSSVKFGNIYTNSNNIVVIEVDSNTTDAKIEDISEFINKMKNFLKFDILRCEFKGSNVKRNTFENNAMYVYSPEYSSSSLLSAERDEQFWYDNINKIYDGSITKDSLGLNDSYRCYVDFSLFENLNLRNHILLYNEIFCSIPKGPLHSFFNNQKITRDEFLQLIKNGRIKIIILGSELEYDLDFLKEAESINSDAIITRRALSSLIICDLVEINNTFILNNHDIEKNIGTISDSLGEVLHIDSKFIYDYITFPKKALRNSFEFLQFGSVFKVGGFGVNGIIPYKNSNLEFEFASNAHHVHIANALDATYFPVSYGNSTNEPFVQLMGHILNSYKNLTNKKINSFMDHSDKILKNAFIFPDIKIFEINEYISILEFEKILKNSRDLPQGLFYKLSSVNDFERIKLINEYNRSIDKFNKNKNRIGFASGFFKELACLGLDISVPFSGSLSKIIFKACKNNKSLHKVYNILENTAYSLPNQKTKEIHFLSKINRIARLQNPYDYKL